MTEPKWKLKVRKLGRWHDILTLLGWQWQWQVREWQDFGGDEEGYYPADLFDWHGRCRTKRDAMRNAEAARARSLAKQEKASTEWDAWYHA